VENAPKFIIIGKATGSISDLTKIQKDHGQGTLLRYQSRFTSTPGLFGGFEYSFEVAKSTLVSPHSNAIPFALCNTVREWIKPMQRNGVTEEARSAYSSPLTI
jgi:hypothetical protein